MVHRHERKLYYMETLKFNELDLSPEILRGVKEMGFEEASPIQSKAIPVAMTGADVIGQAQTGTGKTVRYDKYHIVRHYQIF